MRLKQKLKCIAQENGADLVGIAGIDRYRTTPEQYHPRSLLPQTQSVVSIGVRILRGVLEPHRTRVENLPYQVFGYGWLSEVKLNGIAYEVARWLESRGYLALPFPSFGSQMVDPEVHKGYQGAAISNRHAAVAAGLARFGWSNLAITPEFGPRQRFVTILTSALLEADELLAPLSEPCCQSCSVCIDVCPGEAIPRRSAVTFHLGTEPVRMARLNKPLCSWYNVGLSSKTFGTLDVPLPEEVTWEAVQGAHAEAERMQPYRKVRRSVAFVGSGYCGMCLACCPLPRHQDEEDC